MPNIEAIANNQYLRYLFDMRLNVQTDYALRILMALAREPDVLLSVEELARRNRISRNHLAKVAQDLVAKGYVTAQRGRYGGMRLAKPSHAIRLGHVVRDIENELGVVECLQNGVHSTCAFLPHCKLKSAIGQATNAFMDELNSVTLADISPNL